MATTNDTYATPHAYTNSATNNNKKGIAILYHCRMTMRSNEVARRKNIGIPCNEDLFGRSFVCVWAAGECDVWPKQKSFYYYVFVYTIECIRSVINIVLLWIQLIGSVRLLKWCEITTERSLVHRRVACTVRCPCVCGSCVWIWKNWYSLECLMWCG